MQLNSSGVQTLLAIVATIAGGGWAIIWIILKRENFPKANLDIQVDSVSLGEHGALLRVSLIVNNVGPNIIKIRKVRLDIQQIYPVAYMDKNGDTALFDFSYSDNGEELNWPSLRSRTFTYEASTCHEYEPGESGPIAFDFHFNAQDPLPEVIAVYFHVKNIAKHGLRRVLSGRKKTFGWSISKIITLPMENKPVKPQQTEVKPTETRTQSPAKQTPPPAKQPPKK